MKKTSQINYYRCDYEYQLNSLHIGNIDSLIIEEQRQNQTHFDDVQHKVNDTFYIAFVYSAVQGQEEQGNEKDLTCYDDQHGYVVA